MKLRSSSSNGKRKFYTEISSSSDEFENGGSDASDDSASTEELNEGDDSFSQDVATSALLEEERDRKKKGKREKILLEWESYDLETKQWIAENSDKDTDLMNLNETLLEIVEPTDDLIISLLRFQKEWLAWAVKQENSSSKGGILADEMGMGKTLQSIALVLYKRKNPGNMPFRSHEQKLPLIKGTLVICPLVALKQWEQEIEKSTKKGSVNVLVYHGPKRAEKLHHLPACDFFITTYDIVTAEHSKSRMPLPENCKYKLHSVMWDRIILDEAHYIKDKKSKRTKAVLALQSIYKWALSATPVQNRVGELYSLVRFLQVLPYSCYFCKECDCSLVERVYRECPKCGHHKYSHFSWWHKYVSKPVQIGETANLSCKHALILLKHRIMKSIMLRRTKEGRAADLALPPKTVTLRLDSLGTVEKEYYGTFKRILNKIHAEQYHSLPRDTSNSLYLITHMRQAVNHPYLVEYSTNPESCRICGTKSTSAIISCGHHYCHPCLTNIGILDCPLCLNPLTFDYHEDFKEQYSRSSSILDGIKLDQFRTSSKIDALTEEIRYMVEMDGSAKGIVFSYFSPFLDLINHALHKSGVNSVVFYGLMTPVAREADISRFREDLNCRIFLTTFAAGGVALNLTVASHVFLMEPWYNPAVEWQAQDRVHRIGQIKPVRVVRFIMKNTIEEDILELQKNKELLFEGTVGGSSEVMDKLDKMEKKIKNDIWWLFRV